MHATSRTPAFPTIFTLCMLLLIATPPVSLLFGPTAALGTSAAIGAFIVVVTAHRRLQ